MADRMWVSGTFGSWFDVNNWITTPPDPNSYPQPGDHVVIASGEPVITAADSFFGPISDETIVLGGTKESTDVTLHVTSAQFLNNEVFIRGGQPHEPLKARFLSFGTTLFEGELSVEAFGGQLVINAKSDGNLANFVFDNMSGDTHVLVTQESSLIFRGEQITNNGIIEIEGVAKIAGGVEFGGTGLIELNSGGRLVVNGSVGPGQMIAMVDGRTTLTLADVDQFHGQIGLAVSDPHVGIVSYGGDQIHIEGVDARSASYDDRLLTLYSGRHQKGKTVGELSIELIDAELFGPLPPLLQTLTAKDFTLSDDGQGGTLITFTPKGAIFREGSLAAPVIAETGSNVPLETILLQSFGTATPDFYGMVLIPASSQGTGEQGYWREPPPPQHEKVNPVWIVNGKQITKPTTITASDQVELRVGNKIGFPPQIQVQVTEAEKGKKAEYVTYDVWSTDPAVADLVQSSGDTPGKPVAADVVAAAHAYDTVFHGVLNSDECNWIADDVAAAAGATMPLPNQQPDPSENVSGGFWRIVYRGSDQKKPVQDWSTLVEPGDIVRMEWLTGGVHMTTVLNVNDDGTIMVYDNVDVINNQHTIGIHEAQYWLKTNPAAITIYRLDPDQQYLTKGIDLDEYLHGTVFDDVIRARDGDDILLGEIGADKLKGQGGADRIFGGDGDDSLNGGTGRNKLTGGSGVDSFVFEAKLESGNLGRITDFTLGEDLIQLDRSVFRKIGGEGPLKAKFFEAGKQADDGGAHIFYDEGNGGLYYDKGGDSDPVKFARVEPGLALHHSDFLVV